MDENIATIATGNANVKYKTSIKTNFFLLP